MTWISKAIANFFPMIDKVFFATLSKINKIKSSCRIWHLIQTYDAIVIGAAHNGLVCAAYPTDAGYSFLLLEKRSIPGGGATTEEAPGFKFNLCAIDHEFIHLGSVIEELAKYGQEYLYCDPVTFCPHPDGKYFLAYASVEKTQIDTRYCRQNLNNLKFIQISKLYVLTIDSQNCSSTNNLEGKYFPS